MKSALSIILGLALVASALCDAELDGKVLILTEENFDEEVQKNAPILVEFYAPWCGHCKRLEPEYRAAAETLEKEDVGAKLAKVDATEEGSLATRFGVRGYPTLKFFKSGLKATDYTGGRTANEIVTWMKKKIGPAVIDLADKAAVDSLTGKSEVAIVSFLDSEELQAIFADFAKSHDDDAVVFGKAPASIASEFAVSSPAVIAFNKEEENVGVLAGPFTEESLRSFVVGRSIALISEFSDEMAPKFFRHAIDKKIVVFADKSDADYEPIVSAVKGMAENFRGKLLFTIADHKQSRLMEYFGVSTADTPTILALVVSDDGIKKYKYNKDALTTEAATEFCTEFLEGKLKPFLKSEEIPEKNDGPVTILVGKNFEEIVNDKTKDVLVEFYAPWCGHCKKLEPAFNELGEKYASNPNVVVAKIDATANEVESVPIRGFPTIKFFPANNKTPPGIEFDGDRTAKAMADFIEKHGSATSEKTEL